MKFISGTCHDTIYTKIRFFRLAYEVLPVNNFTSSRSKKSAKAWILIRVLCAHQKVKARTNNERLNENHLSDSCFTKFLILVRVIYFYFYDESQNVSSSSTYSVFFFALALFDARSMSFLISSRSLCTCRTFLKIFSALL